MGEFPEVSLLAERDPALKKAEPQEPAQHDDQDWHNGSGESPDNSALTALHLAHRAVHKFPELTKRYQKFIGTAAVVSSVVMVFASIAVSRRLHKGESPDRILAEITPDEIEAVGREKPARPAKKRNGGSNRTH
jgi:hypothetical protein